MLQPLRGLGPPLRSPCPRLVRHVGGGALASASMPIGSSSCGPRPRLRGAGCSGATRNSQGLPRSLRVPDSRGCTASDARIPLPAPPGRTFPASASSGRSPVRKPTPGRTEDGPGAWFIQLLRGRKASWPVNTGHWVPKETECFLYLWMSDVSVPASLTLLGLFPPIGASSLPLSTRVKSCSPRFCSNTTSSEEACSWSPSWESSRT